MNISEKSRNRLFWVLQFAGWGFLNLISVFFLKKLSVAFVVFSIITGISVGILSTSLLRVYLKRKVFFENFGLSDLFKIVLSSLIAAFLYGSLSVGLGVLYEKYGPGITEMEKEFLKAYDNIWIVVFNSLFIIFSWVVTYLVIKLLMKINKDRIERLKLNTNLKQAQLNTLKGQINPHFMFNSLNNIRGLMLEDVEKSREMLTKLSEMLRYSLTKNNVNAISVEEELEMVDNYIALSKIQFEDRLEYIEEVGKDTLPLLIPPMIVQLLIENATKHGISALKAGGRIILHIKKSKEVLTILVTNTGKLQIAKNSTQLGLKNIRQRLHLLYGDKATFQLSEQLGNVVAEIKIPMP
ncbi:MAG: histidine kinase [Bacteroidota bacterium]